MRKNPEEKQQEKYICLHMCFQNNYFTKWPSDWLPKTLQNQELKEQKKNTKKENKWWLD